MKDNKRNRFQKMKTEDNKMIDQTKMHSMKITSRRKDTSDGWTVWNAGAIIVISSNPGILGRAILQDILGKIIKATITENFRRTIIAISGDEMARISETITAEEMTKIGGTITD